jgi:hypothetical protein
LIKILLKYAENKIHKSQTISDKDTMPLYDYSNRKLFLKSNDAGNTRRQKMDYHNG